MNLSPRYTDGRQKFSYRLQYSQYMVVTEGYFKVPYPRDPLTTTPDATHLASGLFPLELVSMADSWLVMFWSTSITSFIKPSRITYQRMSGSGDAFTEINCFCCRYGSVDSSPRPFFASQLLRPQKHPDLPIFFWFSTMIAILDLWTNYFLGYSFDIYR